MTVQPSPVLRNLQAQGERDSFAEAARRLSGLVPRVLGWTPGEFWIATPAELAAIFTAGEAAEPAPLSRAEFNALMEQDRHG